jgi:hypothetical protein
MSCLFRITEEDIVPYKEEIELEKKQNSQLVNSLFNVGDRVEDKNLKIIGTVVYILKNGFLVVEREDYRTLYSCVPEHCTVKTLSFGDVVTLLDFPKGENRAIFIENHDSQVAIVRYGKDFMQISINEIEKS